MRHHSGSEWFLCLDHLGRFSQMSVTRRPSSIFVVKITKFQANYIDFRKRDMIPSPVAGKQKIPQHAEGS